MINTHLVYMPLLQIMGDYSCGTYGSSTYNSTTCSTSSGSLADTGYNILLPLALGAALIIAAFILFIKRLRRRAKT